MGKTQKRKQRKIKTRRRKINKNKTRRKKNKKKSSRRRNMKGGAYECLNCLNQVRELIRISSEIKEEMLRYYGKKDRGTNILKVMKTIDHLVNKDLHPLLLVLQDSKECRECFEREPKFNIDTFNELLDLILKILKEDKIYDRKEEKYVKLSDNKQGVIYLMKQIMILLNAINLHIKKKINVKDMLRKKVEDRKKMVSPLTRPKSPLIDEILSQKLSLLNIDKNPKIKQLLDEERRRMKLSISPIREQSPKSDSSEGSNNETPATPEGTFKPISSDSDSN
tara:strand:- start:363 stop:1202 length:840 start_codon:yes stop_codon:yes gene_type:complete